MFFLRKIEKIFDYELFGFNNTFYGNIVVGSIGISLGRFNIFGRIYFVSREGFVFREEYR